MSNQNKFTQVLPKRLSVGELCQDDWDYGLIRILDGEDTVAKVEPALAALIAAAPELLEALRYLLSRCDRIVHHNGDEDPRLKAKRALAKATGGAE